MDDPKDLWPLTLGICRDCKACRLKLKTTLDGGISGALYYCNSTMHETDGKDRCADYQPRHRRPTNKDPAKAATRRVRLQPIAKRRRHDRMKVQYLTDSDSQHGEATE